MPQTKMIFRCDECGQHNYYSSKNRTNVTETLKLRKHCQVCRRHTEHLETRLRK